jgi:sulfide:quinone oxidoreductase
MLNGSPAKIAVLGGGFGGLEAAFYLRMKLGNEARITLVSDRDYFLFKPNTIYIPFGLDPERLMLGLSRPTRRKNIALVKERVREIDPDLKQVSTESRQVPYDYLVVATGASMRPAELPGIEEYAHTVWTPAEMLQLRLALYELLEAVRGGERRRVLFAVAPNNKCAGPLYEIALMLDTYLRRKGVRENVEITWSTYEETYIQAFGPRLHGVVEGEFDRRGITGYPGAAAAAVERDRVRYATGMELPYDLLVAFPPYVSEMEYAELPADDRGFIRTDLATRQVTGHPDIYAVGDAADFPIKQAFLAFLQADAAAEHLSARLLNRDPETLFEPVSMCVMEQYDKATFAQVPLRLTGVPEHPVEVEPAALDEYRVGSSVVWRLGKKALGYYLPFRFGLGNPFHAGLPWNGMEAGLKTMSRLMAS